MARCEVGVVVMAVCFVCGLGAAAPLFDGFWRTYNLALNDAAPALPVTVGDAVAQGWVKDGATPCTNGLGFQYFLNGSGPTPATPVSLWFNAVGRVAGMTTYAFGAEEPTLANLWFWRQKTATLFFLSVGFRSSPACDARYDDGLLIGDHMVLNPDTTEDYALPLYEKDAYCGGWRQGSAMKCLGTHYFYHQDPDDLWNSSKVVPIGVMYYNQTLHTIMFITPVPQPGSFSPTDYFWDQAPLSPSSMCGNWCEDDCTWPGVTYWSTMHIFFNSDWRVILPADNEGPPVYRSCVDVNTFAC